MRQMVYDTTGFFEDYACGLGALSFMGGMVDQW